MNKQGTEVIELQPGYFAITEYPNGKVIREPIFRFIMVPMDEPDGELTHQLIFQTEEDILAGRNHTFPDGAQVWIERPWGDILSMTGIIDPMS